MKLSKTWLIVSTLALLASWFFQGKVFNPPYDTFSEVWLIIVSSILLCFWVGYAIAAGIERHKVDHPEKKSMY